MGVRELERSRGDREGMRELDRTAGEVRMGEGVREEQGR